MKRSREVDIQLPLPRLTYLCGFIGIAVILCATVVVALTFRGPQGYPYSVLNRNISDLGKPSVSELAPVFNWGLKIGGLFLMGFMVGLGLCVRHPGMRLIALSGVIAAVAIIFVGVYPVSHFYYHKAAAMTFFIGGSVTFALFTVTILVTDQHRFARWLALPSFATTFAFAIFLGLPQLLYENPLQAYVVGPPGPHRPIFWLPSLLEWLVFATVATWVLIFSVYLYRQEERINCP